MRDGGEGTVVAGKGGIVFAESKKTFRVHQQADCLIHEVIAAGAFDGPVGA